MVWKVLVVDGGFSNMYNNSVLFDDEQVTFFWTLYEDSLFITTCGEKKSGYLVISFGPRMINSLMWV